MILRIKIFLAAFALVQTAVAEPAPEITTITEGYNIIAALPCINCPFLHRATPTSPWEKRTEANALLLNITLPYTSPDLTINTAPLLPPPTILQKIWVPQISLTTPSEEISKLVAENALDGLDGAYFGASYTYTLHSVANPAAKVLHFDMMQLWTDATSPPSTIVLDDAQQNILQVVLLKRPLLSPGDAQNVLEIVSAKLIPRPPPPSSSSSSLSGKILTRKMWFLDWDQHGKKGTPSHLVNSTSQSLMDYISVSMWGLFVFVMAIIALFVVLCVFIVFGCGAWGDEYEVAQKGKRGRKGDVESTGRFRSAEELGWGGRVVGVGKRE